MPVKPSEVKGALLTERDKDYLRDWLNWIDGELVKFRYEQRKPEEDGSFKVKLAASIPISKQIIDALLHIYTRYGWIVAHTQQLSPKGRKAIHNLLFAAPDPALIENTAPIEDLSENRTRPTENYRKGYVYLLKGENGLYKIGRSKSPDIRIRDITKAVAPFDIQIVHKAFYPDCYKAESDLHKLFKEKRRRGEWFELSDNEVMAVIAHGYQAV